MKFKRAGPSDWAAAATALVGSLSGQVAPPSPISLSNRARSSSTASTGSVSQPIIRMSGEPGSFKLPNTLKSSGLKLLYATQSRRAASMNL